MRGTSVLKTAKRITIGAIFLTLITQTLGVPVVSATETCMDRTITIDSSSRFIRGTNGPDVIMARGTATKWIFGLGGDDVICGSSGRDLIDGGSGSDTIEAGLGQDRVVGGFGDDTIKLGGGNDSVLAGAGDDVIHGENGFDSLNGGAGVDVISGGESADQITPVGATNYCDGDSLDTMNGSCTIDTQFPVVASAMESTVLQAGGPLTIRWSVQDVSGVLGTWVYIAGKNGFFWDWCGEWGPAQGEIVSGTQQNGIYEMQCNIPQNTVNGDYTILVFAVDQLGMGYSYRLEIPFSIVGGIADGDAPDISNIVQPLSVKRGEEFTISLDAFDVSGVKSIRILPALDWLNIDLTTGEFLIEQIDSSAVRVSGDEFAGRYEQRFRAKPDSPLGVYTIWFYVEDIYGNVELLILNEITVEVTE